MTTPFEIPAIGLWVTQLRPASLEVILDADERPAWLGLDLQHGSLTPADLAPIIRVADLFNTPVIVRTENHSASSIGRALDNGAYGVFVPSVETVDQASRIAAASRYAPVGARSDGGRRRSRLSETHAFAHLSAPVVLVMIETTAGVEHLEEILGVDGIHGAFVGPVDLARSMGVDSPDSTAVHDALRRVVSTSHACGLLVGMFAATSWHVDAWPALDIIATGPDTELLRVGMQSLHHQWASHTEVRQV